MLQAAIFLEETAPGTTEKSNDIFLIPDATLLVELMLFLVVLVVLGKYVVPPVSAAMRERAATIAQQHADAEGAARKLAEAEAAHAELLAAARSETSRLREEARARHQAQVAEAVATAQAQADAITARTRESLRVEREQAMSTLQSDVAALADQLAGRVIGERV